MLASKTVAISDARPHFCQLVREVVDQDEEIIITYRGRPAAVLMSLREYQGVHETLTILKKVFYDEPPLEE